MRSAPVHYPMFWCAVLYWVVLAQSTSPVPIESGSVTSSANTPRPPRPSAPTRITSPWKWRHLKSVIFPSVQSPPSMLKLHDFCNRAGERIAARHTVRRRPATRSLPGRTKDRQFRRPCDLQQILYAESHRLLPHPDEFRCANLRQSEAVEAGTT